MRRFLLALLVLVLPLHALAQTAKQIVQYPAAGAISTSDRLLLQQGGVGTPFTHGTVAQIISGGLPGSFSTLAGSGDFTINTNKFSVTAASGNTAVAGTLGVTGAATLSGTLGVTGATTLSSTLGVTSTITGTGSIIAGNGGAAPVTLQSGIISVPASQSLSVRTSTAGQTISFGAPSAGTGNALTLTPNSNGNSFFGSAPNDATVTNRLTVGQLRSSGGTFALSGTVTPTAFSGTGSTATVTFAAISGMVIPVGSSVTISGATPSGYNGTYTVTASTNTTVSFASSTTGALSVAGSMAYAMPAQRVFSMVSNWSGAPAAGTQFYPYTFTIPADTADTGGTGSGAPLMYLAHNWGGAAKGSKGGLRIALTHTSATNDPFVGSINQQHVIGEWWGATAYNAGGTGNNSLAAGSFYGTNPQILLQPGATYWRLANAMGEVNLAVYASSRSLTLGGTVTAGDVLTVTFASADITGTPVSVTWTTGAAQTLTMVAKNLVSAINSNVALANAKISASSSGAVVTINWYTHIASLTTTVGTSGGATTTMALGSVTNGASVDIKLMGSMVRLADDTGPGSLNSAFLLFTAQPGSGRSGLFNYGLVFGGIENYSGEWSWHRGSTLIGANQSTSYGGAGKTAPLVPNWAKYGIDFSRVAVAGNGGASLRLPGFQVRSDTTGAVYVGGYKIAAASGVLAIDTGSGATATAVALQSGGGGGSGTDANNYYRGDVGTDDYGGQYEATGITAATGAVSTFTVLNYPSYVAGSAPSNPITVNGGSGSGWTVNATWPSTPALSLQASGGVTNAGGDIKITDQSNTLSIGTGVVVASPAATSGGFNTLLGHSAGKNVSSGAIETTAVGYCSGGAGCRGGGAAGGTGMTGSENTHVGWYSGTQVTTGSFLTAVGVNTMGAETTGNNSVAFGTDAMRNSIGITASVAIGPNALRNGAATTTSVAIGQNALIGDETAPSTSVGSDLIAMGYTAIASATRTTLSSTIGIGTRAGNALQTGSAGVFIGHEAGKVATVAGNMVGMGFQALVAATTATDTVAIGRNAGGSITTAANDVFVGHFAGQGATGSNLVAVGSHALEAPGSTVNAVAVGHNAGKLWTGNGGLFLGPQVGSTTAASGNNVLLIGTNSSTDTPASNTTNYMAIGGGSTPVIFATSTNATPAVGIPGSLALGSGSLTVSAGSVGLTKITASAAAAGAAGGKIELVCGTNSGTAKLIAYAGTSTTAVTILDNIGSGVTGC